MSSRARSAHSSVVREAAATRAAARRLGIDAGLGVVDQPAAARPGRVLPARQPFAQCDQLESALVRLGLVEHPGSEADRDRAQHGLVGVARTRAVGRDGAVAKAIGPAAHLIGGPPLEGASRREPGEHDEVPRRPAATPSWKASIERRASMSDSASRPSRWAISERPRSAMVDTAMPSASIRSSWAIASNIGRASSIRPAATSAPEIIQSNWIRSCSAPSSSRLGPGPTGVAERLERTVRLARELGEHQSTTSPRSRRRRCGGRARRRAARGVPPPRGRLRSR